MTKVYQLVLTTNLPALTVTYYIHLLTHRMLKILIHILSSLDYEVCVAKLGFSRLESQKKCANVSKIVAS